ncbi:MAG: hypothetical protein ACJAUG_002658 [Halioglobus sp.]|jgi:hypothetical protein
MLKTSEVRLLGWAENIGYTIKAKQLQKTGSSTGFRYKLHTRFHPGKRDHE